MSWFWMFAFVADMFIVIPPLKGITIYYLCFFNWLVCIMKKKKIKKKK